MSGGGFHQCIRLSQRTLPLIVIASAAYAYGNAHADAALPSWQNQLSQLFDRADQDSDGRLSVSEVNARVPRLTDTFAQIDLDRDGYLEYPEYLLYLRKRFERRPGLHANREAR